MKGDNMKPFKVSFGSKIAGSTDSVIVLAESADKAFEKARPMLNTHKLSPDFLNQYSRYNIYEIKS